MINLDSFSSYFVANWKLNGNFQFIDSRKDSGDSPGGGGGYSSKDEAPQAPHSEYEFQGESAGGGSGDDEVPF